MDGGGKILTIYKNEDTHFHCTWKENTKAELKYYEVRPLPATDPEPLPCPFCGGKIVMVDSVNATLHFMRCSNCLIETCSYETKAEAIAAINRRPEPDAKPEPASKPEWHDYDWAISELLAGREVMAVWISASETSILLPFIERISNGEKSRWRMERKYCDNYKFTTPEKAS